MHPILALLLLLLVAAALGALAARLGVPRIVGHLSAGVLLGPSAAGFLSAASVEALRPVSQLAIAFIAFLAGAELRWSEVRRDLRPVSRVMGAELSVTFAAVLLLLLGLDAAGLPFMEAAGRREVIAFAVLAAAVAIVHSPAVTIAVLRDEGSGGWVGRTTLSIVLLSDIVVLLVFGLALGLAVKLVPPAGPGGAAVRSVGLGVAGGLALGVITGLAAAATLRGRGRRAIGWLTPLLVAAAFGLSRALGADTMLALLATGFLAGNLSRHGDELRLAAARPAPPLFVAFFALAGGWIDLGRLLALLPVVAPLALARAGAIRLGCALGRGSWGGEPGGRLWLGLVSQAGVAIALVATVADTYPERGAAFASLLLALVAVNEMVGPVLFRRALRGDRRPGSEPEAAG